MSLLSWLQSLKDSTGTRPRSPRRSAPGKSPAPCPLRVEALEDRALLSLLGVQTPFAVGGSPQSVAVGDFNRDGIPDLAVPNNSGSTVSVLLGNGQGAFG